MHTRSRVLAICSTLVVTLFAVAASTSAQDRKAPPPKVDKAQQAEIAAAVKVMDDVFASQAAPTDFTFTWVNHSMKSRDNKMFIPFILTFEKGKPLPANATYYLRVVNRATIADSAKKLADHKAAIEKAANMAKLDPENTELADAEAKLRAEAPKVEYAFEDVRTGMNFTQPANGMPFRFPAAFAAPAGDYDVYVLFKEPIPKDKKATAKAGVLKVPVTVPNYFTDELMTSTVFITAQTEQLKAPPTQEDMARFPYIFGMMRIVPAMDAVPKFLKKDEISIVFYIYNTGADKTTGKPNLTVDYNFYHKVDGAEKFFNRTEPQALNDKTLGPTFDLKAGHQLLGGMGIPLASFPEGEYRLEIKITDKATGKVKVENSPFTIIAG
jgi:hypothetical protein